MLAGSKDAYKHRSIAARMWDTRGDASESYPPNSSIYSDFLLFWRGGGSVQPTRTWASPDTGAAYPVAWTVESGPLDLRLKVAAAHEQAEFPGRVSCWEGAIHAKGTRGGTPVSGKGFAALAGYAPRQLSYAPRQLKDTTDPLPVR